jgi:hypothetical protein
MNKPLKQRTCKGCGVKYTPSRPLQTACGMACSLIVGRLNQAKKARKAYNEGRKEQLTARDYIKLAQPLFNKFIRLRDKDEPCISCLRTDSEIKDVFVGGKWDCGHFLSVGSHPELRFEEKNAYKQCKRCNGGSGNYAKKNHTVSQSYKLNLIDRIGIKDVEWLESKHEPKNYTIEECKSIIALYKAKIKE